MTKPTTPRVDPLGPDATGDERVRRILGLWRSSLSDRPRHRQLWLQMVETAYGERPAGANA
jgi:hypothetical protein